MWEKLKENRLRGFRFKRQHPIDNFIVDFYCHKAKLVIEVDGNSHERQIEYDLNRTARIKEFNLKILRFRNEEVIGQIESVLKRIMDELPLIIG